MTFAVIRVLQDYDYVEDVECVKSFKTEQEATDFIKDIKDKHHASWKNRCDYIDKFVDDIEIPETDFLGWEKFLKSFGSFGNSYTLPKDFNQVLKSYLKNHIPDPIPGYSPPPYSANWNPLFAVEVPDA